MALGNDTFSSIGGAANDLFASGQKATGLRISASGTRIQAEAGLLKAKGDLVESQNYDLAAALAHQNEQFTQQSTAVKLAQADRAIYQGLGEVGAAVASSGFKQSGTALDLLRDSASQGAMSRQLLGQQGLITEAGYREQAESFTNMSGYARFAGDAETKMSGELGAIADQTDRLADKTETQGKISAGIKLATGIASIFL